MLSQASLPSSYWSFAAQTAVSLINILPTSVLHWVSPWTKLFSTIPDLTQLKVFGCACYPNLRPYNTHKLEPKTRECVFIGYPSNSKGYLCLDHHTNRVYISRHVYFNETKFPFSTPINPVLTSSFSPANIPSWFSNQLYLHSTNQPSLLGAYSSSSPITPSYHSTTLDSQVISPSTLPIPETSTPSQPS